MTPPIGFIRIDRDILIRHDLSDKAKMLFGLARSMNAKGLKLSNPELAEILCAHEKSVSRLIADLQDKGLIRIENPKSRYRRIYGNTGATVETDSTVTLVRPTVTPAQLYCNPSATHNRTNRSNRKKQAGEDGTETSLFGEPLRDSKKTTTLKDFVEYWHSKPGLPKIRALSGGRQEKLLTRMREKLFAENWQEIIDKVAASPHCTGKNGRGWKADIDWILKNDENYGKVLEGKYDDRRKGVKQSPDSWQKLPGPPQGGKP